MRRRLYFLLPDLRSANVVHNELLLARIEERHMHVLAREDVSLDGLPEANLMQKSDLIHGLQMGMYIGGVMGIFLSTLALSLGMIVPGLEILSVTSMVFGGACFGSFAASLIAVNVRNTRLKDFHPAIAKGQILYMVDVPNSRLDEIRTLITGHHPEADMRGIDPRIPAFP